MATINPQLIQQFGSLLANFAILLNQIPLFFRNTGFTGGFFNSLVSNANNGAQGWFKGLVGVASVLKAKGSPTISPGYVNRKTWSINFLGSRATLSALLNSLGVSPSSSQAILSLIDNWYNSNINPYVG
jgi:hypothetical protein